MSDARPPVPTSAIGSALDAVKSNPVVMGVLLLNVIFVGAAEWYLTTAESHRSEHVRLLIERCVAKEGK